jgi:hypothetical protein
MDWHDQYRSRAIHSSFNMRSITPLQAHASAHDEMRSVWSAIASLARRPDLAGGRIVVTDQSGEIVVLVGASTARSLPPAAKTDGDSPV